MKDLLDIRNEIDGIDRQIVELFENRMVLTTQVAEYKISTGKAVFDKEREVSKLDSVASLAHSDFNSHGVRELFEHIMSVSRKRQYQLLTEHGKFAPMRQQHLFRLPKKRQKAIFRKSVVCKNVQTGGKPARYCSGKKLISPFFRCRIRHPAMYLPITIWWQSMVFTFWKNMRQAHSRKTVIC